MENSLLIEILRTFDKEELKRFEEFIGSSYFNKKNIVKKLFSIIRKYAPAFNDERMTRENFWKKLFPGKEYNYGVMKNSIYELQKLSEHFLRIKSIEKNKISGSIELLSEYMNRNLKRLFEKETKEIDALFEKSKLNESYYSSKVSYESLLQIYFIRTKINFEKYHDLAKLNKYLLENFFYRIFNKNYSQVFLSNLSSKGFDIKILESVLNFFDNAPMEKSDEILIQYYSLRIAINRQDFGSFDKLKSLIEKNISNFSEGDQFNLYLRMANFLREKVEEGDSKYAALSLDVYKTILKKGLYKSGKDRFMDPYLYLNIEEVALADRQEDWAKKFIDEFKNELNPEIRASFYEKALMVYYFKVREFERATVLLSRINIKSFLDKITIKRYQLMIFYEQDFTEELNSLIDASRHYISIDRYVTTEVKKIFLDFLKTIKKLSQLKNSVQTKSVSEFELRKFKTEIISKQIIDKNWFIEKVEELGKSI